MSASIGTIQIDLEARIAKFESDAGRAARVLEREMQKMQRAMETRAAAMEKRFNSMAASIGNTVKGLASLFGIRELIAFEKRIIDIGDSINDMSVRFGISTQTLSVWRAVAAKSGASLESITRAAKFLTKDIDESDRKLKQIGVSMRDAAGNARPLEQVVVDIAKRFVNFKDGPEKVSAALALLGREGEALIPFLEDMGAKGDETRKRMEKFGAVIGPDFAKMADDFNDNLADSGFLLDGMGIAIGKSVLPAINNFAAAQLDAAEKGHGLVAAGEEIGEWLKRFTLGLVFAKNIIDGFGDAFKFLTTVAIATFTAAANQIGAFVDYVREAAVAMKNPFDDNTILGAQQQFLDRSLEISARFREELSTAGQILQDDLVSEVIDADNAMKQLGLGAYRTAAAITEVGKSSRETAPHITSNTDAERALAEALDLARREWEDQLKTLQKTMEVHKRIEESDKRLKFGIDEYVRSIREEIDLLGVDEQTRRSMTIQMEAEARIRALNEELRRNGTKLSAEEIADMEERIRVGAEMLDAAEREAAAAEPFRQAWQSAIGSVASAFGDFAASGFKGFKGFLDSMKNALRQWISTVIAMLAQRALVNAFSGASGGWAQAFQAALGGGGGTGFNVGNLFGGFGSGTNAYSTVTGNVNPFANAYSGTGPLASGYGTSGNPFTSSTGGGFGGAAMGAGLAAAGAYFSGWVGDTSTGRSTLGGAAAGAAYGTMILPGIGTIVGAIIGAVIGFISQQDPALGVATSGSDISEGKIEGTATSPFGTINVGKEDFDFDAQAFATQLAEFDKVLADIMTSTEIAGVRAALANWEVHQEGADKINPQAIFESRFNVVLGQFDPAIQAFARAGSTLEDKVERFGQALGVSRIFDDLGLDIDFAEFLDLAREAQIAGEDFGDTVSRLAGATHLLGDVFDQLGVDVADYGATFIRFAADVAEAMGGIEAAGKAWSTIMSEYYSPTERSLIAMDDARDTATAELADVGLDPTISKERFRELFEEMLRGTPTPAQIAEWVQAGVALAAFTDATDAYNATLTETTRVAEAAAQAGAAYGFAIADLQNELLQLSTGFAPSQFVRDLAGIRAEEAARGLELNRLAVAAGEAAAAEGDLALVHQISAVKAAQAIARLRAAAQSLVNQLYGGSASTSDSSSATSAISTLDSTAGDMFRSWEQAIANIAKFLDDILLDEGLTTLTPQQQLTEAQSQFADLLARAQAGDVDAAAALPAMARELLDNARDFWASGDAYDAIFRSVMEGLAGITAPAGIGTGRPGGVDTTLETTIAEAEAAAEEVRQQRLLMAVELAGYLRDLGQALGQSVFELAAEMGVKLEAFVTDLGIDLTALSAETATQLAAVANTLGVELSDLTNELGISLGALRDANSYLNDALESAINAQPTEIRSELGPLLTAIETATNDADANLAIANLEAAVAEIGGSTALALAPFLEAVDPPGLDEQLAMLDRIGDAASEYLPSINAWLQQIATNTGAEVPIDVDGSFDTGTAYVPYDQVALVHKGEKIIDADTSAALSKYGIQVRGGQDEDRGDIKLLLRENLRESKAAREQQQRNERAIIAALERIAAGNGKRGG